MVQVDSNEELLATKFAQVDIDKDGKIDASDFLRLCKRIEGASNRPDMINVAQRVLDGSQKYPGNHSGYGTLKDFIRVAEYVKTGNFEELSPETSGAVADSPKVRRSSAKQITRFAGATGSSQHSMEDEELAQYVIHINEALSGDPILSERLPLDPNSHELFPNCADGLLLAKLINVAVPDTIDERVLNTPYQAADLNNHEAPETPKIENKLNGKNFKIRSKNFELNTFQKTENLNLVIASAKGIGCRVVNIGAQDLIEGREHLVLGLVWQIIQRTLLANVSLLRHPELYRLLESGETLEHLLQLSPENLLMRWVNYHLQRAGSTRRLTSFSVDLRDSEIYAILMVQLAPAHFSSPNFVMKYEDMMDRAVRVLEGAEVMNCARYLTPRAIVQGNPRLNLAFLANLFNHLPGLQALTVSERSQLDESLFACADDREGRAFALWLNSLDLGAPDSFVVNSIYEDLKDGIILLYAFDAVRPGTIQWKRVNKRTSTQTLLPRFKALENVNYAIEIGTKWNFSLVGIQGADIADGSRTLTLALVWQLMRAHIFSTLSTLRRSPDNMAFVSDLEIVEWANNMVKASEPVETDTPSRSCKYKVSRSITGFKDSSISDGHFLLQLLDSIAPGTVDYGILEEETDIDRRKRTAAKYAISVSRKLGAVIFLLPEDIVEVKPRMVMTFVASLMAIYQQRASDLP